MGTSPSPRGTVRLAVRSRSLRWMAVVSGASRAEVGSLRRSTVDHAYWRFCRPVGGRLNRPGVERGLRPSSHSYRRLELSCRPAFGWREERRELGDIADMQERLVLERQVMRTDAEAGAACPKCAVQRIHVPGLKPP